MSRFAWVVCALLSNGCTGLVEVDNPGVIEGTALDPVRDGRTFSLSARQNFATAYGPLIVHGAWSTGEALSAETMLASTEFDRRDVTAENEALLSTWVLLSVARASAERTVSGLLGSAGDSANLDIARAALFAGYGSLLIAENFCQGAVDGGPPLPPEALLARAVEYFTLGLETGRVAARSGPSGDRAEASVIALAALVGRARARLQTGLSGERPAVLADAAQVPDTFTYALWYSDSPGQTGRLGNAVWHATGFRGVLNIAPAFRDLGDPRVPVAPPSTDFPAIDGITPLWTQQKYRSYAAPIRLASGLEARYLKAEAQGSAAMLALLQERREANGIPRLDGPSDEAAVTTEFMAQRAREFFLEGKRMGDARRHPGRVPDLPVPGAAYHRSGFAPIGSQQCWPLPSKELSQP
jgi:hypothetical protein